MTPDEGKVQVQDIEIWFYGAPYNLSRMSTSDLGALFGTMSKHARDNRNKMAVIAERMKQLNHELHDLQMDQDEVLEGLPVVFKKLTGHDFPEDAL